MQEGYKFQFSKAELNVFYLGNVVFILTKSDQLRFMPGMYVHFSAQKSTDDLWGIKSNGQKAHVYSIYGLQKDWHQTLNRKELLQIVKGYP